MKIGEQVRVENKSRISTFSLATSKTAVNAESQTLGSQSLRP